MDVKPFKRIKIKESNNKIILEGNMGKKIKEIKYYCPSCD